MLMLKNMRVTSRIASTTTATPMLTNRWSRRPSRSPGRIEFSDGIVRDSGDALLEFMEFAIQWRTANRLATSAFAGTPAGENAPQAPRKVPARKAARKTPAKKAAHRP